MYHIDRETVKPDIGKLEATLSSLLNNRGIRLEISKDLKSYYSEFSNKLKNMIQSKYNIANPNSPKQIISFLQEESAKVDLGNRNDIIDACYDAQNDKWTSDASALGLLADLGYEFAIDLLEYRKKSKYAACLDSLIKFCGEDGIIHPKIRLAKTHRISYYDPGLLTIPKDILWEVIKPYKENNILYSVDIKNQEPTILINMTNATELKPALKSDEGLYNALFKQCFKPFCTANILINTLPENRVYNYVELYKMGTVSPVLFSPAKPLTENVFYKGKKVIQIDTICIGTNKGVKPNLPEYVYIETEDGETHEVKVTWDTEEIDKKYKKSADYSIKGYFDDIYIEIGKAERTEFKTLWLAISYGASKFITKNCKIINGSYAYDYITKMNGMKEYRSQIDKWVKQGKNMIFTIFGTPIFADDTKDAKALKRELLNLPIQGSGADILSLLVKHFYDYKKENNLDDKMELYFTRHDELIIEIDKDWQTEVGDNKVEEILNDIFEHQIDDWTPFKIEVVKIESSIDASH